jgi:hypothetical protein
VNAGAANAPCAGRGRGGYPLSDSLHRNQTLYRLADTIRYVYGRRPPQAPTLTVDHLASLARTGAGDVGQSPASNALMNWEISFATAGTGCAAASR